MLVQKHVNFMSQELSRFAFIELFTDDDMNITTMRKLMKNVFKRDAEQYHKLQEQLAGNAREQVPSPADTMSPIQRLCALSKPEHVASAQACAPVCCDARWLQGQSKFLSEISQRKMSEASLHMGDDNAHSSFMQSLLSKRTSFVRPRQSIAIQGASSQASRRQVHIAGLPRAASGSGGGDTVLPVPPDLAAFGEASVNGDPALYPMLSILNTESLREAEEVGRPGAPAAMGSFRRPAALPSLQTRAAGADSLGSMPASSVPSFGSMEPDPTGAGALGEDATSTPQGALGTLGALWGTAYSSLSGRRMFAAAAPAAASSVADRESASPAHVVQEGGGREAQAAGAFESRTGDSAGHMQDGGDSTSVLSNSLLHMRVDSSLVPQHRGVQPREQHDSPRSAPFAHGVGFDGPMRPVDQLAMAEVLWRDLVRAGSAPPTLSSNEQQRTQESAAAAGGGREDGVGTAGAAEGPSGVVASHAVDFRMGAAGGMARGGGERRGALVRRGQQGSGPPRGRRGGGSPLGEGLRRRSHDGAFGDGCGDDGRDGLDGVKAPGAGIGGVSERGGRSRGEGWRGRV